jgi:hypothetical protein
MMEAYLHPPIHKEGVRYTGRYQVTFNGEIVVKGSRDPETDLARALLAKGITGMVKVFDANTGKHRTTVNIEKAAKLRVKEGPLRFGSYEETLPEQPYTGEEDLIVPTCPSDANEAA